MKKVPAIPALILTAITLFLLSCNAAKRIDDGAGNAIPQGNKLERVEARKTILTQENYEEVIDGLKIKMVAIPGDFFQMGSPESDPHHQADEGPVHDVKVDGFWLSSYEVTWDLYEKFLNREKSQEVFSDKMLDLGIEVDGISGASMPYVDMSKGMGKEGFPVTNITQYAALTFCKWLSAKTGHFYRLPTEAEWEYACKQGLEGSDSAAIADRAWTKENSPDQYQKVGTKAPNALGIYDMQGNVTEWTMDQYRADFYTAEAADNPWAYPDQLYPRTLRGGSWKDTAEKCTCTARRPSHPRWKRIDPQLPKSKWWFTNAPFVGFRILRPYKTPAKAEISKYWLAPIDDY